MKKETYLKNALRHKRSSLLAFFMLCITIFSLLIFYACKKEKPAPDLPSTTNQVHNGSLKTSPLSNLSVSNGTMYISDFFTLDSVLKILSEMSEEDHKIFEDTLSFMSLYSLYDSIYEKMDLLSSVAQEQSFVANNSKYLAVNSDGIINTFPYDYYFLISNRDGIFVVDQTVCRITKYGIIALEGTTVAYMKQLIVDGTFNINSISGMYFFVEPYSSPTGCGSYKYASVANGNRKVEIWIRVNIIKTPFGFCSPSNSPIIHQKYRTTVEVRGKRWLLWDWRAYKTFLEFKDVYLELDVPEQTSYNNTTCTSTWQFIDGYLNNESEQLSNDWYHLTVNFEGSEDQMGGDIANVTLPNPYFLKVKGKASSRGVTSSYWAIISCGY